MNLATAWWVACGVLIAIEMATGTFYLLMLALGCATGALLAHLGLNLSQQLIGASLVGGAAVAICHFRRSKHPKAPPPATNTDLHLDIGQSVQVDQWQADGSCQVKHRGALWQARFQGDGKPHAGRYVIRAMEGNQLLLDHPAPTPNPSQ